MSYVTPDELKIRMQELGVLKEGHFLLPSGKHSHKYIEKDAISWFPELLGPAVDLMIGLGDASPDIIADAITGSVPSGIVLAVPVATQLGMHLFRAEKTTQLRIGTQVGTRITDLDRFLKLEHLGKIVKEAIGPIEKEHFMNVCSGYTEKLDQKKVILFEDVITTGDSVKKIISAIDSCHARVVEVRCVWNCSGIPGFEIEGVCGKWSIPILSVISEKIDTWEPEHCPLCRQCMHHGSGFRPIPLTNPENDKVIV